MLSDVAVTGDIANFLGGDLVRGTNIDPSLGS